MTHPHPASRSLSLALLVALVPALLLAGACGSAPASSTGTTTSVQAPAPDTGAQDVLAVVNGEEVTLADLQDLVGDQLGQMDFNYRSQRHRVIDNAMRHYVRDQLIEAEAAKRDMTVDELTEEIGADQEAVSEDDVRMFYLQNQAQLQGRPYESIAPQIRLYLEDQRRQSALQEFADGIAETYGATYMLEPFRVSLDVTGAPVYGREDAPVTLVEFSDFQCPYCESFVPTLQRIKDDYADDVKIVFMHFPLRQIHPNAQKSAEASMCAFDQGKFWEAHDMYFAEQDTLDVEDLKEKATRLGLDSATFDECLDSGKYVDYIDEDVSAGIAVGVDGTPAIFVNGRPLPGGAVPFEMVAELIDDELGRGDR